MDKELIAPCGMNCGICMAYLREKNKCPGCSHIDPYLKSYRRRCIIRNCETIKNNRSGFCYECEIFPCRRLKQLDKRYTTKYHMSMLANLSMIRDAGIDALVKVNATLHGNSFVGSLNCRVRHESQISNLGYNVFETR